MLDLATLHEAIAAAVPDRECFVWREQRRTWGEMADRSRRLAQVLHGHGLGLNRHGHGPRPTAVEPWESPHDHLALYLHNGPEYLEGLLAAHKARIAPFNVNYRYVDDELGHLFVDGRPAAVIYHARFAPTLARVLDGLDGRPGRRRLGERLGGRPLLLQVADESGHTLLEGALDYETALAGAAPGPLAVQPSASDLHILYTGGTTGMPKGVLWRIGDLMIGPLGLRRRDGTPVTSVDEAVTRAVRSRHRVLVAPPFMHGSGTWSSLGTWCAGGTVVLPARVDHLDPADVLATCARERVTRLPLVGDAFARPIADELERGRYDLAALRTILNSGAAMRPSVKQRLARLLPGVRLIDAVGSSETGVQVSRDGTGEEPFLPDPNVVVLSADRTRPQSPGEHELGWLAQGGPIPLGYLGDPDRTAQTFVSLGGRRLAVAGDRARLLADGRVEVHGREATTINTGGEKVFAEEVETVIRSLPGVADALVVGRPSERWGHEIVAVVELTAPAGDDELRAACAGRLARYKIPKAFVRVERVPRLPNGKADYAAARAATGQLST